MIDKRHDHSSQVDKFRCYVVLVPLLVVLALVAAACGNGNDAAEGEGDENYNLRIGFVTGGDSLGSELIKEFAAHAEAESEGRITVQPFYEGALGGESEMLGQISEGSLDMGLIGSGVVSTIAPKSNITELPYLWESETQLYDIVFDGPVGDEIAAQVQEQGIKLLGWGDWGPRDIFSSTPVESADDLEGLQIRVVENQLYLETLRAWGAVPTPIPFPETYSALQQGVVDAVDTNSHGFVSANLYEVTDYVSPTAHIHTALQLLINQERWEALPDDIQQILVEAAEVGMDENREVAADNRERMFEIMQEEGGMEIIDIDTTPLEDSAVDIQNQFAEKAGFTELLSDVRELKAER